MKLKKIIYIACGAAMMFASCDDISEGDRLTVVEQPAKASRSILVEEFSGQLCVNCPEGADELAEIQHTYGLDTVIVVSIHAGVKEMLAMMPAPGRVGLATDFGEALYTNNGRPPEPCAVIDRRSGVLNRPWWAPVTSALQEATSLILSIDNQYTEANDSLIIRVSAKSSEDLSGNINVWLTEDSIVGPQSLPSGGVGGYDMEHVFNHIFRASATPIDGDPINLAWDDAEPKVYTFRMKLDEGWRAGKMSVVAFVANGGGVCQTAKAAVVK